MPIHEQAVPADAHDVARARRARGHDRNAARHRFDEHVPKSLVPGTQREYVGSGDVLPGITLKTGKRDGLVELFPRHESPQRGLTVSDAEDKQTHGQPCPQHSHGLDQQRIVLASASRPAATMTGDTSALSYAGSIASFDARAIAGRSIGLARRGCDRVPRRIAQQGPRRHPWKLR